MLQKEKHFLGRGKKELDLLSNNTVVQFFFRKNSKNKMPTIANCSMGVWSRQRSRGGVDSLIGTVPGMHVYRYLGRKNIYHTESYHLYTKIR